MRAHSRFVFAAAVLGLILSACGSGSSEPSTPAAVCGNGKVEAGEACDDGNTAVGDGCTAACLVQPGWTCTGQPSVCIATCGNGALDPGEACDDGNRASGDGCSSGCAVEPGYSCSGAPSVCVAGCGDGVRAGAEQCDDGNQSNLDGCDATCRLEQVLRVSRLVMAFAPSATCPRNAFGGAVVNGSARTQLQASIDSLVSSGALTFLLWVRNLDDLSGNADGAVEVASVGGAVHPDYASAFSNASELDGWFTADARGLDPSRVPTARVSGSIAGGVLSAGPGRVSMPLGLAGSAGLLEMADARLRLSAVGLSAPAVSLTGSPPGHLLSEHLQNGLQSFSAAGAGEVCGGILARSLAEVPLAGSFVTLCNTQHYTSGNSFLDMLVGGCALSAVTISAPTQPDQWDSSAPLLGAGGPYHLSADPSSKAVTGCTDKNGGAVSLATCLDTAAFSSLFQFSADRVIVKPACGDGFVGPGEACDDGNRAGGDGCSASCAVEAGWACAGSPSVCTSLCGNGTLDAGEECDDGNRIDLDGCSASCAVEAGWTCSGAPSACSATCGDGIPVGPEQCDDGNLANGDGCSSTCAVETGWACQGRPSACQAVCGDGLIRGAEQCDDGNTSPGDGCSPTCAVEAGWVCSGEPSACASFCAVTSCDDGIACTVDVCDQALVSCVHTPQDAACDDGNPCNGAETCSAPAGCQAGTPPPDGTSCPGGTCQGGLCLP